MPVLDRRIMLAIRPTTDDELVLHPMWAGVEHGGSSFDVLSSPGVGGPPLFDLQFETRRYFVRWLDPSQYPGLSQRSYTRSQRKARVGTAVYDSRGRRWDVTGISESQERRRLTIIDVQRQSDAFSSVAPGDLNPATDFPEDY